MRRGRSRRRRRQTRLVMYGGMVVLLTVVLGTAGVAAGRRNRGGMEESSQIAGNGPVSLEEHLAGTVTASENTRVEGIDITGLSRTEAEKLVKERLKGISVVWEEESAPVEPELSGAVSKAMDEIYVNGQRKTGSYQLDSAALEEAFRSLAKTLAGKWNQAPVNSQMESYQKDTGIYTYSEAKPGLVLDEDGLVRQLSEAVKESAQGQGAIYEVKPVFAETPPERTAAQAKEQYRVIGSFTTETTNNKNRNENIRLAVEAIDGRILKPGEEFSFNLATGNRTKEKGYQPAGAYRNGVLIEEPGGGVCQVSTTLYNAIVNSGLKATERNSHSFTPSYIQPGQDAMVSFDGYAGPDLKFVNTEQTTVAVRASLNDNKLKISIVGLPVLEEGVKVTMRSEKVRDVDQPAPVYEENGTLPSGTEKVVDHGTNGSVWKTFRVVTRNGEVVEEMPLHNTTYRGKAAVIQKNDNPAEAGAEAEAGSELEPAVTEAGDNGAAGQSAGNGGQEASGQENDGQPASAPTQPAAPATEENGFVEVPAFPGLVE